MKQQRLIMFSFMIIYLLCISPAFSFCVYGEEDGDSEAVLEAYEDYMQRFLGITSRREIENAGFDVITEQIFPIETECFGNVVLIPALEKTYHRLVLFWAKEDGSIVYRTDQLEADRKSVV